MAAISIRRDKSVLYSLNRLQRKPRGIEEETNNATAVTGDGLDSQCQSMRRFPPTGAKYRCGCQDNCIPIQPLMQRREIE